VGRFDMTCIKPLILLAIKVGTIDVMAGAVI
jgi:hypothetical protein